MQVKKKVEIFFSISFIKSNYLKFLVGFDLDHLMKFNIWEYEIQIKMIEFKRGISLWVDLLGFVKKISFFMSFGAFRVKYFVLYIFNNI